MLKRLELVGFKSFADKTRLDFDPGVSAIVGPNGSGKSNIVDAIRWILGEQSAKSLRGKEMADVIFNGSGTRRAHGMAEVSLYLDNSRRFLPLDVEEVVLARRVFRSGESEYFINGQTARLKDIRELFLGTGAGHHAYSVIEQGKVDQILQSSTKDRRHIFEEAAGISRFKAKKIEALRRLERIQQNLIRVHDIHEEVDRQLRSLRAQASRARRFRELTERFKTLRVHSSRLEYGRLTAEVDALLASMGPREGRLAAARLALATNEPRLAELDEQVSNLEAEARKYAGERSTLQGSIASLENEISHDQDRHDEVTEEIARVARQQLQDQLSVRELSSELDQTRLRHEQAVADRQARVDALEVERRGREELEKRIEAIRQEIDASRARSRQSYQDLSRLENEQAALESQLSFLWQQREKIVGERDRLKRQISTAHFDANASLEQDRHVRALVDKSRRVSTGVETKYRDLLNRQKDAQDALAEARQRESMARSRLEILEQLRQRHEGLDAGVRQVLSGRGDGEPIWSPVLGVLAEQVAASSELADIVELALGNLAQSLVVQSLADISDSLLEEARKLSGRVHFLAIEDPQADRLVLIDDQIPWPTLASLVRCEDRVRPLIERLLGQTYLADDFAAARRMASRSVDLRFITPFGDILEPDGSVSSGPTRKTAGILSRAAEIEGLGLGIVQLQSEVERRREDLAKVEKELASVEGTLNEQARRRTVLSEQSRHLEWSARQALERIAALDQQFTTLMNELEQTLLEIKQTDGQGVVVESKVSRTHELIAAATDDIKKSEHDLAELTEEQSRQTSRSHEHQTALAVADERLGALRAQEQKLSAEYEHRRIDSEAGASRLDLARARRRDVIHRLLRSRAQLAEHYRQKDQLERDRGAHPVELEALRAKRSELSHQCAEDRRLVGNEQEALHQSQLRLTEWRLTRDALVERLKEDYGVDLAQSADSPQESLGIPEDGVVGEIDDLRDKIARLGTVNSEALAELDDLEKRSATFAHQIQDLTVARRHLEHLIGRINDECRRMFLDSFETIRQHFQELFRKLFGGGKADMLLEDETDVLESGIEIIARPPGKEPQSISLLSGGEKTLTAAAMVMAIFRSKPSPFCILDEVDAALDEANIGRFVQLLREFSDHSQFILITHSKTTMASADVLHGITQRESGVSIRVSVRLEDVTDDGQFVDRDFEESEPAA